MKPFIKASTLLSLFTILVSCNSNPTEPEPQPGRRDYTWTADTIKAYYIDFNSIWGKTANDVWTVSSAGSVFENIYRYNGTKWYRETRTPIGNTVSLFGTDYNLWICCKDGRIWNYKNNVFSSSPQFNYEDKEILFLFMAGRNDNEIYACGGKHLPYSRDGIIYKFNGDKWGLIQVIKNSGNLIRMMYSPVNSKYYILAYLDNEVVPDTVKIYEYEENKIKLILENSSNGDNGTTINEVNGWLYVSIGNKIYRYYGGNLEEYLNVTLSNFGGQIWGRNKNDLFIRMFDGLVHYNGSDLQYILKFPSNITFGSPAIVLEKDIFLHAFDDKTGYNIIYHGQLK